jgi:hypothetical protein
MMVDILTQLETLQPGKGAEINAFYERNHDPDGFSTAVNSQYAAKKEQLEPAKQQETDLKPQQ